MQEISIKSISSRDTVFPESFTQLPQPVEQLFYCGNIDLLKEGPRLGIVGSRKVTNYGRRITNELGRSAARAEAIIVSGLAIGVDGLAHQAALEGGGKTIAVLPNSLLKIYPAAHLRLAREIIEQGGLLISEFENDISPMKHYFIQRNRLIAALSDTLLVVEAAQKSGSLHTAEFASELGKTVCAVPGNIDNPYSKGTNRLIQQGAMPVLNKQDLFELLSIKNAPTTKRYKAENDCEAAILSVLKNNQMASGEILEKTGLPASDFNVNMTMLEIKGVILEDGNNVWRPADNFLADN